MTRALTVLQKVRFRLRDVEHTELPTPLRQALIKTPPDPYEGRSASLKGGREIIFLHVPKTGGTSLSEALKLGPGHIPATRFQAADPDRFERSFKFAVVHDPVDKLLSSAKYLRTAVGLSNSPDVRWSETYLADHQGFHDFMDALQTIRVRRRIMSWPHFRPMHSWLCRPGDTVPLVDFLGRFESLSEDMVSLAATLGVSVDLPHTRESQNYLEKKITLDMINFIREIYRSDVEIF